MNLALNNHPFAVDARFDFSLVLTYAISEADLQPLLMPGLELDTHEGNGFVAVAMVQTRNLRPHKWPPFFGRDFFLIGYRIFVRYRTSEGRNLRGLYIIRSETDNPSMKRLGKVFTHYDYHTIDVAAERAGDSFEISSEKSGLKVVAEKSNNDIELPCEDGAEPIFKDWKSARKFAGPLPFTFTTTGKPGEVLIVEGVRQNWKPQPVNVIDHEVGFLDQDRFQKQKLASGFLVEDIDYSWKKGRIDRWK